MTIAKNNQIVNIYFENIHKNKITTKKVTELTWNTISSIDLPL